ncbi:NAD(P)-dependent oxidoreductase [Nocardia terpenica]|uniref:NAD-binding protein n=1 Tax=Nocardia terpenica TaxID=455432 RepID=A0A6G9Z746_9NOCA|nr:NAD(P)-dependent oxidoreductase [Nocardia terpenica]QIS20986.1 NAD-binding protein [Nocardia terpenica]
MTQNSTPLVGFIGLGHMGGHMSANLVAAGYRLLVHDMDADAVQRLADLGAERAGSIEDLPARCDVVITMLPGPPQVESVIRAMAPHLRAGSVWVDMSTSTPAAARVADDILTARGVFRLDAPVSGMAKGAAAGTLQIFVGGEAAVLERVRPVFEVLGDPQRVLHVGGHGAGYTVKLMINQLWFSHLVASAEVLTIGLKAGVDLATLHGALLASPAASAFLADDLPAVFDGDYDDSFAMKLACKDLGLSIDLSRDVGVPAPLSAYVEQIYRTALARFGPDAGEMTPIRLAEELAMLQLRLRSVETAG